MNLNNSTLPLFLKLEQDNIIVMMKRTDDITEIARLVMKHELVEWFFENDFGDFEKEMEVISKLGGEKK